jgi:hypothetical protein
MHITLTLSSLDYKFILYFVVSLTISDEKLRRFICFIPEIRVVTHLLIGRGPYKLNLI